MDTGNGNGHGLSEILPMVVMMSGNLPGGDGGLMRTIMMLVMLAPKLVPLVSRLWHALRQLTGRLSQRNVAPPVHVKTLHSSISYSSSGEVVSRNSSHISRAVMMALHRAFLEGKEGSDAFAYEGLLDDLLQDAVVLKTPSIPSTLAVSDGIHLSSSFLRSETEGASPVTKHELVIRLFVDAHIHPGNLKFDAIKAFLETCRRAYDDKQRDELEGAHLFSIIDGDDIANRPEDAESDDDDDDMATKRKRGAPPRARPQPLTYYHRKLTNRVTSTPSFPEKEELIHLVEKFVNSAEEYEKRGMNHTLSIMLQSPPGCGKSRFFLDLAVRLNLVIIQVAPDKVLTEETLHELFRSDYVDGCSVPHNRRLYVIEDVDCSAWFPVLQERSARPRHGKHGRIQGMFDLDFYLNTMDGMVPRSGQIVAFTVNGDPKLFDSAVLRPGRIDAVVRLHRMSAAGIAQLYRQWFDRDLDANIVARLKDNMYSVAEMTSVFRTLDEKEIRGRLLHMFPADYRAGAGDVDPRPPLSCRASLPASSAKKRNRGRGGCETKD